MFQSSRGQREKKEEDKPSLYRSRTDDLEDLGEAAGVSSQN